MASKVRSGGIRRYQNPDGSLTPEGRIHYGYGDGDTHGTLGNETRSRMDFYGRHFNEKRARTVDSSGEEVWYDPQYVTKSNRRLLDPEVLYDLVREDTDTVDALAHYTRERALSKDPKERDEAIKTMYLAASMSRKKDIERVHLTESETNKLLKDALKVSEVGNKESKKLETAYKKCANDPSEKNIRTARKLEHERLAKVNQLVEAASSIADKAYNSDTKLLYNVNWQPIQYKDPNTGYVYCVTIPYVTGIKSVKPKIMGGNKEPLDSFVDTMSYKVLANMIEDTGNNHPFAEPNALVKIDNIPTSTIEDGDGVWGFSFIPTKSFRIS